MMDPMQLSLAVARLRALTSSPCGAKCDAHAPVFANVYDMVEHYNNEFVAAMPDDEVSRLQSYLDEPLGPCVPYKSGVHTASRRTQAGQREWTYQSAGGDTVSGFHYDVGTPLDGDDVTNMIAGLAIGNVLEEMNEFGGATTDQERADEALDVVASAVLLLAMFSYEQRTDALARFTARHIERGRTLLSPNFIGALAVVNALAAVPAHNARLTILRRFTAFTPREIKTMLGRTMPKALDFGARWQEWRKSR